MIKPQELAALIEDFAPASAAEEWDNVGLLYDSGRDIKNVLVALDATAAVYGEAAALGCEAVVTHHPLVIEGVRRMSHIDAFARAAQNGVSVIAAHTNFDIAAGGVNDVLAKLLGIERAEPFGEPGGAKMGRVGNIEPLSAIDFLERVKTALGLRAVSYVAGPEAVSRVAVLGGSGGDYVAAAQRAGADAFVTGEAKHHEALRAADLGILLVAAGHYETEHPAVAALCEKLQKRVGERAICRASQREQAPFLTI